MIIDSLTQDLGTQLCSALQKLHVQTGSDSNSAIPGLNVIRNSEEHHCNLGPFGDESQMTSSTSEVYELFYLAQLISQQRWLYDYFVFQPLLVILQP